MAHPARHQGHELTDEPASKSKFVIGPVLGVAF